MPKSSATTVQALCKDTQSVSAPLPAVPDFTRIMLRHPNQQLAAQLISEQAELEFQESQGEELERLKQQQVLLDEQYKSAQNTQGTLKKALDSTQQFVKFAGDASAPKPPPFWHWRRYDQFCMVILVPALFATLVLGAANVYTNLMASGEQIFLEMPGLAVSLSMLVPAASTALKFIANFFAFPATRKRYALTIYSLTAIAVLIWSISFAIAYPGVAAEFDWDSIGDSSDNRMASLLVWVQLSAEILIATALFLAAEDITFKYAPPDYTESKAYLSAKHALETHTRIHDALAVQRGENAAAIAVREGARQKHVNSRVAEYLAHRAHSL